MRNYKRIDDITENELEDMIRLHVDEIEDGMKYVDHQIRTPDGRLDVLLVDYDKTLVIVELKVNEDDDMLMQAVDYYDWANNFVDMFARTYRNQTEIDPKKQPRLALIAPSFSQTLLNRCKWMNMSIPISLIIFTCLKFDGERDLVPVFTQIDIPEVPEGGEIPTVPDIINSIKDDGLKSLFESVLAEIKSWEPDQNAIAVDATKTAGLSLKFHNHVFAYLRPWLGKQFFILHCPNEDGKWIDIRISSVEGEELERARKLVKNSIQRISNKAA